MSLVYDDGQIALFHGDCLDLTGWANADVLITDPPYGMAYVSNFAKQGTSAPIIGDRDTAVRDAALELWGPHKPALVFGTWKVPPPVGNRQTLIWHKEGGYLGDLSLPWGNAHEEIYVLGGREAHHWAGRRTPSVIRTGKTTGSAPKDHDHPTPKPVALMQALVAKTTGAVIADPFAGSGATLVAAKMLGRKAIGIEMDAGYIDTIIRRLERLK